MSVITSHSCAGSSTSASLLARVKADEPLAWERLIKLYGPLVYRWARGAGLQSEDAADVVQDVFQSLTIHIKRFRRSRPSDSFRGWLWTITRNRIRDFFRDLRDGIRAAGGTDAFEHIQQLPDTPPEPTSESGTVELGGVRRRALDLVQGEFDPRTWQAFWRAAVEGDKPADIAADLDVTVWAVYKARSRVLQRLREELDGLGE